MRVGQNYFAEIVLKELLPFFFQKSAARGAISCRKAAGSAAAQRARRFCRKAAMRRQPYGGRRGKCIFYHNMRILLPAALCLRR